jgi:hypothetical protein
MQNRKFGSKIRIQLVLLTCRIGEKGNVPRLGAAPGLGLRRRLHLLHAPHLVAGRRQACHGLVDAPLGNAHLATVAHACASSLE